MTGKAGSPSDGVPSRDASLGSAIVCGQCFGADLGEHVALLIKPGCHGESEVVAWADERAGEITDLVLLECGYDLVLCSKIAT